MLVWIQFSEPWFCAVTESDWRSGFAEDCSERFPFRHPSEFVDHLFESLAVGFTFVEKGIYRRQVAAHEVFDVR